MKKLKKPTSAMLIATMIFVNSQTLLVNANEEINGYTTKSSKYAEFPMLDVDSIRLESNVIQPGDGPRLRFNVYDDSEIKDVKVFYKSETTGEVREMFVGGHIGDGPLCMGYLHIEESDPIGKWEICEIYMEDVYGNSTTVYNSNLNPEKPNSQNLSAGDFTVIEDPNKVEAIEGVTVFDRSKTIKNQVIEGDVYISPACTLTIEENVTIKGDLNVLGIVDSKGGLKVEGTVNTQYAYEGGNPMPYSGTIILRGINEISSMNISDTPVTDIPLRIDTELLMAEDGLLDISGATLDVATMYINGNMIDLDYKGRFDEKGLEVGYGDELVIEFALPFGYSITKTYYLLQGPEPPLVELNNAPQINANDIELRTGDEFNPLDSVTAEDKEDGYLTHKIEVIKNNVDTSKEGTYEVTYKVTDSKGASTTKTIKVTVVQGLVDLNNMPTIEAKDITIKVGDKFEALKYAIATDKEDGDITSDIEIIKNDVDISKEGVYEVTYKVSDSTGASTTKTIKVEVIQGLVDLNNMPTIEAKDITINIGDKFEPLKYAQATDKEDGDITSNIEVIENNVDTSKEGTYEVTYKVSDSTGVSTTKTIKVNVIKELVDDNNDEEGKENENENTESGNDGSTEKPDKDNPQTGDGSILGYTLLGALSLGTLVSRKRNKN